MVNNMSVSINKQKGFVTSMLWVAVLIGFLSVTAINNSKDPVVSVSEDSESYKQADLQEIEPKDVTTLSIIDEE